MLPLWPQVLKRVDEDGHVALVSIVDTQGSTPREVGARMLVTADGRISGTIGGGTLEYRLIDDAKTALSAGTWIAQLVAIPLGPDLGQCCGGHITALIETFSVADHAHVQKLAAIETGAGLITEGRVQSASHIERQIRHDFMTRDVVAMHDGVIREMFYDDRTPVLLFGAGHIGRALTLALAPLPFRIRWIDSRDDAFPKFLPQNVSAVHAADIEAEINAAPADAFLLVMTHSHPLDLAIVSAALKREDLPFIGLIGSETKKARFIRRLSAWGLGEAAHKRLVSPIGLSGISGKEPAVIAISVAADLLIRREALIGHPAWHKFTGKTDRPFEDEDHLHERG